MTSTTLIDRLAAATGNALICGVCGTLLAAFESAISSTALGMEAMTVALTLLGGCVGRLPGAILGGMSAVLLAALGSLVGGSVLGVALMIVGSALLGGWVGWANAVSTLPTSSLEGSRSFATFQTVPKLPTFGPWISQTEVREYQL